MEFSSGVVHIVSSVLRNVKFVRYIEWSAPDQRCAGAYQQRCQLEGVGKYAGATFDRVMEHYAHADNPL
jgi:hypothetical protein